MASRSGRPILWLIPSATLVVWGLVGLAFSLHVSINASTRAGGFLVLVSALAIAVGMGVGIARAQSLAMASLGVLGGLSLLVLLATLPGLILPVLGVAFVVGSVVPDGDAPNPYALPSSRARRGFWKRFLRSLGWTAMLAGMFVVAVLVLAGVVCGTGMVSGVIR